MNSAGPVRRQRKDCPVGSVKSRVSSAGQAASEAHPGGWPWAPHGGHPRPAQGRALPRRPGRAHRPQPRPPWSRRGRR